MRQRERGEFLRGDRLLNLTFKGFSHLASASNSRPLSCYFTTPLPHLPLIYWKTTFSSLKSALHPVSSALKSPPSSSSSPQVLIWMPALSPCVAVSNSALRILQHHNSHPFSYPNVLFLKQCFAFCKQTNYKCVYSNVYKHVYSDFINVFNLILSIISSRPLTPWTWGLRLMQLLYHTTRPAGEGGESARQQSQHEGGSYLCALIF